MCDSLGEHVRLRRDVVNFWGRLSLVSITAHVVRSERIYRDESEIHGCPLYAYLTYYLLNEVVHSSLTDEWVGNALLSTNVGRSVSTERLLPTDIQMIRLMRVLAFLQSNEPAD